jgi:hypothetical protein
MIITTKKPFDEVLRTLEPYRSVLVVGCGVCATECQTGGEKQVAEMKEKLLGTWEVDTMMVESPCDERISKKDWRKIQAEGKKVDVLLVLACGAGVQVLAEVTGLPCMPGLNTQFIGKVERIGLYHERCRACSDCILAETGGICPITRCAKGLVNGPCGGMIDGKCEVGGYVRDCAWYLIYKELEKQDRLDLMDKIRSPRSFNLQSYPRGVDALKRHEIVKGNNPLMGPDESFETIQQAVSAAKKKHG